MEVQLTAGAKLDFVSPKEMREILRDWQVELMRGGRPREFDAQGTIANNAVTVGGNNSTLGPEAGFVWALDRTGVTGLTNATDATSLFRNDSSHPKNTIFPALTGTTGSTGYHEFVRPYILMPNDRLLLASTAAIGATGVVTLWGQAWELPIGLLWRLL